MAIKMRSPLFNFLQENILLIVAGVVLGLVEVVPSAYGFAQILSTFLCKNLFYNLKFVRKFKCANLL